jgi:hypothetical protein
VSFPDGDSLVDHELEQENFMILADERFPGGCFRHVHRGAGSPVHLNELWWTLTDTEFSSRMTSICGCKDCNPAARES